MNKQISRTRRGLRTKHKIKKSGHLRLVVYRSAANIYSQIVEVSEKGDKVLVSSSTVDKELKASLKGNKCDQAAQVGELLAKRAKKQKLTKIAFDRAGYKYHGRVKALADAARSAGLDF